ncbi:nuclear transport factor 2 family protein [Streptomyces sp. SAJ15]|uniref:nuclear transport factor 2 family protein n=1 Tax=Streptomyces sp. SAJ15 TaxID=2011095 RepID=UPI0016425E49|nr:nuclear transport factor 2 family protein [Streptomyces sp. SAJ15]
MTATTATGTATTATDTVRAFFAAFATHDLDQILALVDEDAHWYVPGEPALVPWAGERRGHASLREFFELVFTVAEPLAFDIHGMAELGDTVLIPGRFAYRYHRSGQTLDDEFILKITVRDGLVTDYRIFEDSLRLARAYLGDTAPGALPGPAV